MRTPSTDPDLRRYDRHDEFVPCAECRSWMLPLNRYEISKAGEAPALSADAEPWQYWLHGWMAPVYNWFADLFTYESRKRKLAQLKQQSLPEFPNSLVCPRCLSVSKRR